MPYNVRKVHYNFYIVLLNLTRHAREVHTISQKIVFSDEVARIMSTKFEGFGQSSMHLDVYTVAIDNFSLNGNFRTAIIILHTLKMERKGWT